MKQEDKPLTTKELYELRKTLVDWKWRGPEVIFFVLSKLCKGTLEKEPVLESKIYKSIYLLKESIKKAPSSDTTLYNRDQINNILLKIKSINNQIKELVTKQTKPNTKKLVFTASKFTDTIPASNIHVGDYLLPEQRTKIQEKLKDFIQKLTKTKVKQELFNDEQIESKIKLLSEQLEICLYNKHLNTIAPEKNFNSELKTLYMYLNKDKQGIILHNLLEGVLTINQACQLQLKDWLNEEFIRELEDKNKIAIQDDDADYYRSIKIKEMTQSKGMECPKCHNYYLYLIEFKQTRRADEPTTAFYECFACNHKYRV